MSFRVVVQNATTVLHKKIHVTPLTQLIKTHVTVLLARPTFIHSSATHNLSGRPFSPKNQQRLLPCFLNYKCFQSLIKFLRQNFEAKFGASGISKARCRAKKKPAQRHRAPNLGRKKNLWGNYSMPNLLQGQPHLTIG